jgi:hypothetical protein
MRVVGLAAILVLAGLAAAVGLEAQPTQQTDGSAAYAVEGEHDPILTVHISGDKVVNDEEAKRIEVAGNVRILAYTSDLDSPRVGISAEMVSIDTTAKVVEARGSVLLRTEQGAFRGEDLYIDMRRDEMRMSQAVASVNMPHDGDRVFRAFFRGDEIRWDEGSVLVVVNGIVTPCEETDDPDVAASVGRLVWNSETGEVVADRGKLHLLGVGIPLLSRIRFEQGRNATGTGPGYGLPGYSGYDGIYVPLSWEFLNSHSGWSGTAQVRVATRSHLRGVASIVHTTPAKQTGIWVSRQEFVTDDITRRLSISRRPEIRYVRHFDITEPHSDWEAGVSLGRFHERDEYTAQVRSDSRASLWGRYVQNPEQKRKRDGHWYGAQATQNFYDRGSHYRDISVEAGIGGPVTNDLNASLELIRHHPSGASPFLFDDVDIELEALGTLKWQMTPRWGLYTLGRYDVKESSLRDYRLELSRRSRYLTWTLGYRFANESLGLRVDINGLTGDTEPAETKPVVSDDEVQLTPEWVHEGSTMDAN